MGLVAAGNITPCSFLVQATTADHKVSLASGNSVAIIGISGKGTRRPSGDFFNDDGYHAIAGENVEVIAPPKEEAQLQLGGTVAAGDLLTSDGSGFGVAASSTQMIGARAREAGVSGQIITVQPLWGKA